MKLFLSLFLIFYIIGCRGKTNPSEATGGGVVVGNGMSKDKNNYYSAQYAYGFSYARDLDLQEEQGGKSVLLSNKTFLSRQHLRATEISTLSLQITDTDEQLIRNGAELKAFAMKKENPAGGFSALSFPTPGAIGFAANLAASPTQQKTLYYFLTNDLRVVRVLITQYPNQPGSPELTDVIRSFHYDLTPPKISKVGILTPKVNTNSVVEFVIHATDDFSGLVGGKISFLLGHARLARATQMIDFETTVTSEQYRNGALRIKVPVPVWAKPGTFHVSGITLTDYAGNETHWTPPKDEAITFSVSGPFRFEIYPVPEKFKAADRVVIKKGETGQLDIEFNIVAEGAGMVGGSVGVFLEQIEGDNVGAKIYTKTRIRAMDFTGKDRRVRVTVKMPRLSPPGKYRASLTLLQDIAADMGASTSEVMKIIRFAFFYPELKGFTAMTTIENENDPNPTPARIDSLALVKNQETTFPGAQLILTATDPNIGFEGGGLRVALEHRDSTDKKPIVIRREFKITPANQRGKGIYVFRLSTSGYAVPGEYKLRHLAIHDAQDHQTWLQIPVKGDATDYEVTQERPYTKAPTPRLNPLKVQSVIIENYGGS